MTPIRNLNSSNTDIRPMTSFEFLFKDSWHLMKESYTILLQWSHKTKVIVLAIVLSVLLDCGSTYYFIQLEPSGLLIEGNPFTAHAMKIVGVNGWVFVGGFFTILLGILILLGKPKTPFQYILWFGLLATCVGKLLSGLWNIYLLASI